MRRALLALVLVGCSKPEAKPAPVETVPSAAPVVKSAEPPPAPKAYQGTISFAHFAKDQIFECIDATVQIQPPGDAGADWAPKDDPIAKLATTPFLKKTTKLSKPCGEQFGDRTVLASCTLVDKGERHDGGNPRLVVTFTSNFYNYEDVGPTDEHMKDCLQNGGDWKALSRDSAEWKKAKLEHSRKGLQKAVDRLQKQAGEDD